MYELENERPYSTNSKEYTWQTFENFDSIHKFLASVNILDCHKRFSLI